MTGSQALRVIGRREDRHQPVIILLRDRVELVAVAAGTVDRQAQQARPHDLDRVVHDAEEVLRDDADVFVRQVASGSQVAGGDQCLAHLGREMLGLAASRRARRRRAAR